MKKVMLLCVLVVGMLFVQGCATIICGTTKTVNINSVPHKAEFEVRMVNEGSSFTSSGKDKLSPSEVSSLLENTEIEIVGTTPQNVTLRRRAGFGKCYIVTFRKEGY